MTTTEVVRAQPSVEERVYWTLCYVPIECLVSDVRFVCKLWHRVCTQLIDEYFRSVHTQRQRQLYQRHGCVFYIRPRETFLIQNQSGSEIIFYHEDTAYSNERMVHGAQAPHVPLIKFVTQEKYATRLKDRNAWALVLRRDRSAPSKPLRPVSFQNVHSLERVLPVFSNVVAYRRYVVRARQDMHVYCTWQSVRSPYTKQLHRVLRPMLVFGQTRDGVRMRVRSDFYYYYVHSPRTIDSQHAQESPMLGNTDGVYDNPRQSAMHAQSPFEHSNAFSESLVLSDVPHHRTLVRALKSERTRCNLGAGTPPTASLHQNNIANGACGNHNTVQQTEFGTLEFCYEEPYVHGLVYSHPQRVQEAELFIYTCELNTCVRLPDRTSDAERRRTQRDCQRMFEESRQQCVDAQRRIRRLELQLEDEHATLTKRRRRLEMLYESKRELYSTETALKDVYAQTTLREEQASTATPPGRAQRRTPQTLDRFFSVQKPTWE